MTMPRVLTEAVIGHLRRFAAGAEVGVDGIRTWRGSFC